MEFYGTPSVGLPLRLEHTSVSLGNHLQRSCDVCILDRFLDTVATFSRVRRGHDVAGVHDVRSRSCVTAFRPENVTTTMNKDSEDRCRDCGGGSLRCLVTIPKNSPLAIRQKTNKKGGRQWIGKLS